MTRIFTFLLLILFAFTIQAQDIHSTIRGGDVNKVYEALTAGADINALDAHGRTPLMIASLTGNYKIVAYLLENKCDINAKDYKGRTALDYAVRMKNVKIIELLKKNKAVKGAGVADKKYPHQKNAPTNNKTQKVTTTRPANTDLKAVKTDNTKPQVKQAEKEKRPQYPGGNDALHKYLKNSVVYPDEAKKDSLEGTVHVKFEVTPKGDVVGVEVTRSDSELFNKEAVRVVKDMPKWKVDGVNQNRGENFEFRVPVNFKIKNTKTSYVSDEEKGIG